MSIEPPTLYPTLRYRDARAAITFLTSAFGFRERVAYPNEDGTIAHAELSYGPSLLMLGTEKDDAFGPRVGQTCIYVAVDDADAHCSQARAAGAVIISDLHDTDHGSRDYAARDPEGNVWSFGTYRPAADRTEDLVSTTTH